MTNYIVNGNFLINITIIIKKKRYKYFSNQMSLVFVWVCWCIKGMKVSCTHFQCSAGAFTYLRDHYSHSYSSDMSSQALSININLMLVNTISTKQMLHVSFQLPAACQFPATPFLFLSFFRKAQAQECLLEKTLLDHRKSHLIAKICAQVRGSENECRSLIYTALAFINVKSDCRCVTIIRIVSGCWRIQSVCQVGFRKSGGNSLTWRSATSVPSHTWDHNIHHALLYVFSWMHYFNKPCIILFSSVAHGKAVRGTAEIRRSSKCMLVCV